MFQLLNAFQDVIHSQMAALFWRLASMEVRFPTLGQLLDGGDIYDPVVEVTVELWHVFLNEFFVLSHGVPGQYALTSGGPGLDKVKDLFLSIFYADFAV